MAGILKVRRKLPLFIAVPTTAGTGSETTLASVITDSQTRHKYAINDFPLIPHYAVLDPAITVSLPPFITATTGMDALTHAAHDFIQAIYDMKKRFGIGDSIKEIQTKDIAKLARYADKEANPLYPVPVLMNAHELEKLYVLLQEE